MAEIMTFNIIHHRGMPQTAVTEQGITVHRQDRLFIPMWGGILVRVIPYDDHFIYENPNKEPGQITYLCTCGSIAVLAPTIVTGKP